VVSAFIHAGSMRVVLGLLTVITLRRSRRACNAGAAVGGLPVDAGNLRC